MKRVKVDFSTTVRGGLIRANQKRAAEPLNVGDQVEAYDPAEALEFLGVVDHLSDDKQFAYLRMEWEDSAPIAHNVPGQNLFVALSVGTAATTQPTHEASGYAFAPPHVGPPLPLVAAAHPISA
jgi:hypothetical protein